MSVGIALGLSTPKPLNDRRGLLHDAKNNNARRSPYRRVAVIHLNASAQTNNNVGVILRHLTTDHSLTPAAVMASFVISAIRAGPSVAGKLISWVALYFWRR